MACPPGHHEDVVAQMVGMGIPLERIEKSLADRAFDHIWATYHLISDEMIPRSTEVCFFFSFYQFPFFWTLF